MQEYRLYVFEAGRRRQPTEFEASDDEAAIEIAGLSRVDGRQMELWQHGRKVRCWGFPDCPSPQCGTP